MPHVSAHDSSKVFFFREGCSRIRYDDIVFVESELHYLKFVILTSDGQLLYTLRGKLDDTEEYLRDHGFIRIHKSYLLNKNYIEIMKRFCARLKCGTELPISKKRYNTALESFLGAG